MTATATDTAKPAALFTVWNTGRQYTDKGQRMAARIVGDVILFADVDRGIAGKLTNALPVELIRSESDLKREVMSQYDNCAYSWHGFDFDDEMEELKTAAETQQVPAAPKTEEAAPHIVFIERTGYIEFRTSDGRTGSNPTAGESAEMTKGRILQCLQLFPGEYTTETL